MSSLGTNKQFVPSVPRRTKTTNTLFISQFVTVLKEKPFMSSDELNVLVSAHVEFLYAQYGVQILEHGDWIHTGYACVCSERNGYILTKDHPRPLNSWAIKNPIVVIPSDSDLEKIADWRRAFLFKETRKRSFTPKPFQVRNAYIINAIQQLETLQYLLSCWRVVKNPTEQSECGSLIKDDIQTAISNQNKNIETARDAYKLVVESLGPEFLRDSLQAVIAQEEGIRAQLFRSLKTLY